MLESQRDVALPLVCLLMEIITSTLYLTFVGRLNETNIGKDLGPVPGTQ